MESNCTFAKSYNFYKMPTKRNHVCSAGTVQKGGQLYMYKMTIFYSTFHKSKYVFQIKLTFICYIKVNVTQSSAQININNEFV